MGRTELTLKTIWQHRRKCFTPEVAFTALTLLFIGVFHGSASQDRLLLNLYYVGIVAAAYALVKRSALSMMVLVLFVAAGTTLAQVYFTSKPGISDPLLAPVCDLTAWTILLFFGWRLAIEAYRFQTEEHQLQLQRRIDKEAMATRAAALTSTSHEVRQPLSAILALSETLLDESAGPLNEVQRDFVGDLDGCAKHLMSLINEILDYAKAEAGMIKLVHETVALPELVNQCVMMVEPTATEAEVEISVQIDPAIGEIMADPLRLKQILLNLLSNAVKFNERGGSVKLQVRTNGSDVCISVRDTGRGVNPEQLEHLFDPYYQAAHGDGGIGTGLGLSIIKHLVNLHAGSISVDSVPGSGTVFTIQLPGEGCPHAETDNSLTSEKSGQDFCDMIGVKTDKHEEIAV